jgi:PTH1 family peptidyl-tRNA hydrolase
MRVRVIIIRAQYGKIKPMKGKVFVGLGNPGKEYEATYHNVGAILLCALAKRSAGKDPIVWHSYKNLYEYANVPGCAFVIPLTFMNESGNAVREALKKYHATAKDLIVLHDDSDLPVGEYKIATGQGSAGHKGVQSVVDALGTNDFERVRVGIRDPREKERQKAEAFVLQSIKAHDKKELETVFLRIAEELAAR